MVFACCKQVPATAEERMNTFSTRPVLHYFDIPGRAEAIRLAFIGGGIDFEDKRYTQEEFGKHGKALSPSGKLPVLETDGKLYVESLGILEYVCALSKHAPRDAMETLVSSMIMHEMDQVWGQVTSVLVNPTGRDEAESNLKQIWTKIDAMIQDYRGEPGHIIKGLSFCPADLAIIGALVTMEKHLFGLDLGDMKMQFPNVYEVKEAVMRDNKAIKDYLSSH